ncbi:MAG: FAD-dependent oxidoreductase, partial [Clostridiales bacterium]
MKRKFVTVILALTFCLLLYGCGNSEKESTYTLDKNDHATLTELNNSITEAEKKQYDEIITTEVAVIGSDPEGIAAAVSAARNGMDTRLIDFNRDKVGGLYTLGWLNMIDLNYAEKGGSTSINQGIFAEVLAANDNKTAFTIEHMEKIFNDILTKAKVKVKTDYAKDNYQVIMDGDRIIGIGLYDGDKKVLLKALKYIDSTQNADIARLAGVEYYNGLEELNLKGQRGCDTLVFQLKGVDWQVLKDHLQNDDNKDTGADNASAWGYSEIKNCKISDPDIYMRGPNIGLQEDGTILLNGLQIFHMDIDDDQAMEIMRKRVTNTLNNELIPFMRENFVGWENAELAAVAPEFYIRESYHVKTIDRLVGEDAFQSNFPENFIASGSYSIDLQAREKGLYGIALYGTSPYGIPFGAMVSDKVSNLLIAGKCAGYDSIAAGSARTVPVGMSLGQGAGAGAAYAVTNEESDFRNLAKDSEALSNIQSLLNGQGAKLEVAEKTDLQKNTAASPYFNQIKYLRDRGLLTCGYTNDYQLKETATRASINSMQYAISSNSPYKVPTISQDILADKANINSENLLSIINLFLNTKYKSLDDLATNKILSEKIVAKIDNKKSITNEVFYGTMGELLKYMEKDGETYYA